MAEQEAAMREAEGMYAELGTDMGEEFADEEYGAGIDDLDAMPEIDFHANLAELQTDAYLGRLAQDVCEWVDTDEQTRKDWEEREARGIRLLGVSDKVEGGADFPGASRVVHPMLALAMVQFSSRALKETWPAGGPVKTIVLGERTQERADQAERVEGFLNYAYTELMPGAFEEQDRLLQRLPLSGSVFVRAYFCPVEGGIVRRVIEPSRVYVPHRTTDLRTAKRFTYEFEESANDTRRKQSSGFYLDEDRVTLQAPMDLAGDRNSTEEAIDDAQGTSPVDTDDEDATYTRYECACFLDLPGFEDEDAEGEATGVGLPYLVTVDKDSQRVLRISRNWRYDDERKQRRVHLIHYRFSQGYGFFGWGLYHLIGGLSSAATAALRSLLDAAYLHNMKGGLVSRDAAMRTGNIEIQMGKWTETDLNSEDLKTAFHEFIYSPPSDALVKLLELIQNLGGQLGSTMDNLLGDANNNAPVGTTLALIEQGLEPITAIHKRMHEAARQEFRLVAELISERMADEYPYAVEGGDRYIMASDFDGRVDVVPVSDPNTVTNTQRIARAQSVVQLADANPDIYDRRKAHAEMLKVMRIANVDEYLPQPAEIPRRDPVSEGSALLGGQPVRVYPDQDHGAHLAVHAAWWRVVPQEMRKKIGPMVEAHVAEHYAALYRAQMAQAMGIQLPMDGQELAPEVENQLAQMAAQVAVVPMPEFGFGGEQAAGTGADIAMKAESTQAEIARKDAVASADIMRDDRKAQAQMERELADSIAADLMQKAGMSRALDVMNATEPGGTRNAKSAGNSGSEVMNG
jgi:hypothetical protein